MCEQVTSPSPAPLQTTIPTSSQVAIRKFYSVLGTMARISKVCVLRLTADKLFFILSDQVLLLQLSSSCFSALLFSCSPTLLLLILCCYPYFIPTLQAANGGPAVWAEMRQEHYFNEYNIEGVTFLVLLLLILLLQVSPEQNEIFLELVPDKLAKTLSSLKSTTAPARSMKVHQNTDSLPTQGICNKETISKFTN